MKEYIVLTLEHNCGDSTTTYYVCEEGYTPHLSNAKKFINEKAVRDFLSKNNSYLFLAHKVYSNER